jgi:hypothetical protein
VDKGRVAPDLPVGLEKVGVGAVAQEPGRLDRLGLAGLGVQEERRSISAVVMSPLPMIS